MARTKKDLDDYALPDREYYPVDAPGPTTAPPSADDLARQQRRAEQKKKAKEILQTGGRYAVMAGGALVRGAQMASEGIRRYSEWVAKTNAEALARQEQEQKLALERRRRELERRKAAMEIQREQLELAREERRLQLEMAREEAQFRREFGGVGPQQGPARQQGSMFGYGAPQQPAPFLNFGYGAPQQPASFLNYGPAFGTPAPGFRSPAEIFGGPRVGYESGAQPRRSAPGAPGRKKSAPKRRSPR